MADEELTLILRLRDEATKQMKSARAGIVAAGAAIAAAGFTAGKKWDDATKTIVSARVRQVKPSLVYRRIIRLSPNTETEQPQR